MFDISYEAPMSTPAEVLADTGLAERQLQVWVQRGYFPRATRPGRGVPRQFALADHLYLGFLRVASQARIPLSEASLDALHLFPAMETSVPPLIMDVIRSSDRPDLAPQVFAVFHDGRAPLIVTKEQIDEAWAPTHEGEAWSVVIDVTRVVLTTINGENGVRAILARRAGASSTGRQCRQAESGS